jgi:acyl-coenzyme A thioesterase PaaI-like protein
MSRSVAGRRFGVGGWGRARLRSRRCWGAGACSAHTATRRRTSRRFRLWGIKIDPLPTIEMHMRFLRPVFSGRLTAQASVLTAGERIVQLEGAVRTNDGTLVAAGTASFAVIPVPDARTS